MGGRGAKSSKVIVMTEEKYLSSKGYAFMGYAEAGLHVSNSNVSKRQQKENVKLVQDRAFEYDKKRAELREEYRQLVKEGKIRKPTMYEEALEKAKGDPSRSDVQSAIRILEKLRKKGIRK